MEYREFQKFNQWWLWAINLASLAVGVWAAYVMYQDGSFSWWTGATLALILVVFAAMALVELKTTIDATGVEVSLWPFSRRRIAARDIKRMYVRTYSPIGEYGGWGYRTSLSKGVAYNMSGNKGLQLELTDGKQVLIGTQRPEELAAFVERYLGTNDVLTDEAVTLELKQRRAEKLDR